MNKTYSSKEIASAIRDLIELMLDPEIATDEEMAHFRAVQDRAEEIANTLDPGGAITRDPSPMAKSEEQRDVVPRRD